MIESIFYLLQYCEEWSLEHMVNECNQIAQLIAVIVTRDHRYQSYVAARNPVLLDTNIRDKASS